MLRLAPQAIEAEQCVIGGFMLAPAALLKVADWLKEEDFYRRDHQLIYRAILELAEKRQPYDAVTLGEWFQDQGMGEMVGGGAYLVELASNTPSAANIVAYAEIVKDKARLRSLIDYGTGVVNAAFDPAGRDVGDIVAEAQRDISNFAAPRVGGVKTMKQVGAEWFDLLQRRYAGETTGLMTPWAEINRMIGGLSPGDLGIIAARPSMGKSALALNAALALGMAGKRSVVFSMEMTAAAIYNRCAAALMNIPLEWFKNPRSGQDKDDNGYWPKATEAVGQIGKSALMIDDQPGLDWTQIVVRAKREHLRSPLSAIFVDHMHIMRLPGKGRPDIELGDISREFKGLAKELNVPVIALAQLNRSVEKRENKRPVMSDLREAGGFEQDADWIAFLYRDDYYARQLGYQSRAPGLAECIIAKNREGETGTAWLRARLDVGRFEDADRSEIPTQQKEAKRNHFDYMDTEK
jgi:replicative DNA helicase